MGAETAYVFAQSSTPPARILLLGRSLSKIQPVIDRIAQYNKKVKTNFIAVDLSDNGSVRDAANKVAAEVASIDIMINSAGIMALADYHLSKDGFELQLAANHIGHFLLTGLLLPQLEASKTGARVVSLTSTGYEISDFRWDDWNFSGGETYERWTAYAQSKTANLLFTNELSHRGAAKNITAITVHPGVILSTGIMKAVDMEVLMAALEGAKKAAEAKGEEFKPEQPKSLEAGCSTTAVAALRPDLKSGVFLRDCQPVDENEMKPWGYDETKAGKLWTLSESWVGEKFL